MCVCGGTGILFEEPNPTGSRPSDLIGLCRQHTKPHPQHTRKGRGDKETPNGEEEQRGRGGGPTADYFKRETEHLCLRQPMNGIGGGPRSPARETVNLTPTKCREWP